jgi:hypothetical protein
MTNLKKNLTLTLAATAMLLFTAGQAHAQSGSRLCGFIAVETPNKVGLLYEARTKDASYKKQCDEAISKMKQKIDTTPQLKAMTWQEVKRWSCEDVGNKGFVNQGESSDICDKMEAKVGYKVTKAGAASATYAKQ